ncbi:chromosomal replication initiator protein DnaA [Sediminitomix flava]|uniref:Chromosomal replication initiator protein DnaA n=1 Tax=Sediminitomix flava TaxID=379075 RepID=A0A315ZJL9_SEDFL|nr:chromosomal replication initiator protein DnaA [Sediminitomix flava]PWJ44884.1 chromosomal replication initiator protein [Sediminitomix flava]
MEKDCHQIWQNCLEIIRKELSEQSFRTWFMPIKPVKLANDVLTIEVPSPFFYEWLEEYYVHLLKKAINSQLGPNGKLEYSIPVVQPTRPKPQQQFTDRGAYQAPQNPTPQQNVGQQHTQYTNQVQQNPYQQQAPSQPVIDNKPKYVPQERPLPAGSAQSPEVYQQNETPQRPVAPIDTAPQQHTQNHAMPNMGGVPPQSALDFSGASNLNPEYTFDTFIEGDCNRLARSAGIAIAKKPGATAFNPLVIYGGVGLGKTHLVQAIGQEIKRRYPDNFVLYVTCEQFTTQFIEALKSNSVQQFTNYYLQVDTLIVDDIQFLSGKEKTQENFFHIFNHLHQRGKQILMTTDCPPKSLKGLQERLLSRFKWGLTADIQKPDFETRLAIVQQKLVSEGMMVPEDVLEYLAYNIDSNIRELEGVLISLIANASLMKKEIDLEMAKSTLLNIVRSTEQEITIEFIQGIVADYFGISVDELLSKTRKKDIANARQIAMYFSKEYTEVPLKSIGDSFGGRDHSTVVHATKAVSKKIHSDILYNRIVDELLEHMKIKK